MFGGKKENRRLKWVRVCWKLPSVSFPNSLTFQDSCKAALPVFHPTESVTALMKSEDDEDDRNHEAYHVLLLCGFAL